MYKLICFLFLMSGAYGQIVLPGVCNYANIGGYVTDLNITGIFGNWNQIARIENSVEKGECSIATFKGIYDSAGNLLAVNATIADHYNKTTTTRSGTIQALTGTGVFLIHIPDFFTGDFVVQATNYADYAILYACDTLTSANSTYNGTKAVLAWQYHRKTGLSSAEQTSIQEVINLNPDLKGISWQHISHNKTACGNGAVSLAIPHILVIVATLFLGKEVV